jgi:hypothetical protein
MRYREEPTRQSEDISWRQVLQHRTALRELVCDHVPELAPAVECLDFARARLVQTSFIDAAMRGLESDIVWRIPMRGRGAYVIYILIEHQSTPDRLMALRMFRYVGGLYGRIVTRASRKRRAKEAFALPLVVPIVLYCGARRWNAPLRLEDLLPKAPLLREPIATLRYILIDVNALSGERLEHIENALSGLFLVEKSRLLDWKKWLRQGIEQIIREKDKPFMESAYLFGYNVVRQRGDGRTLRRVRSWLRKRRTEDPRMVQTLRQFIIKVGREEGLEEGLRKTLASLRKALRRRGVDPEAYKKDFAKIRDVGKAADLIASFVAAKDPRAHLRRRFGH